MTRDSRRHPPPGSADRSDRTRGDLFEGHAGRPAGVVRWTVLVRKAALPAADATGLTAAVIVDGADHVPVLAAVYAASVLAVLAASRLHRLPVCLRTSDQTSRIVVAVAAPLPILLLWPSGAPAVLVGVALRTAVGLLVSPAGGVRSAACGAPAGPADRARRGGWRRDLRRLRRRTDARAPGAWPETGRVRRRRPATP